MALANSVGAIAAVTEAVTLRLHEKTGLDVTVGRPEPASAVPAVKRLNVFLYELHFDGALKNVPLDEGQQPPLWLVLKYLLTAFEDDGKTSDSIKAYENLGLGLRALQELSFLPLAPITRLDAVIDNPQDLKITFDEAPLDMLSKVMQGSDEKYRLSVAFQVRPVLIAPAALPSYSLLVGVDYTVPETIGEKGIKIPVIPSLGPTITEITPDRFERNATVTIKGTDLHLQNLSVNLGPVTLPVTMQQPDQLQFVVRDDIATADVISAGSHAVTVSQLLPTGRRRLSNLLAANLLPSLSTAVTFGVINTVAVPPPPAGWRFGTIDITGELLGKDNVDDFYLSLYRDGKTFAMLDVQNDTSPAGAPQTQRRFVMAQRDAVPPGEYLVIYRVNGQQAPQGFPVDLS
jgi:Pvc16 N-terminal domain